MEIAFIYPDMHGSEYIDSVNLINRDIGKDNMTLFIPNMVLGLIHLFFIIIWAIIFRSAFFSMTQRVTAAGLSNIVTALLIYAILAVLSFQLIAFGMKKLRPLFLSLIKKKDSEESFSFSEYVERQDENKKARTELDYYKMCDLLKKSKITDASTVCDGKSCKVEVAYENEHDSSVLTFYLDYYELKGLNKIVVDFSRKRVLFPEEVRNEETR